MVAVVAAAVAAAVLEVLILLPISFPVSPYPIFIPLTVTDPIIPKLAQCGIQKKPKVPNCKVR